MVFSSFLSACAANINIKTTVCTIFSLPATKIQYPATAAGNRVTERPQADRQNPDRRLRRRRIGPVVHRSTGPENAAGRSPGQGPTRDRQATGNRTTPAGRKATGQGSQTFRTKRSAQNGAQPGRPDERPGRGRTKNPGGAGRETRTDRKRDPGGAGRETRAERDKKPGRSGTRNPGGHKKTDRNLQIAVRRFGSGSLTSRFSYRSALRNGS